MSDEYLIPKDVRDVPRPFLIVCEGMSDVRFIGSLLEHIGITTCSVGCPSREGLGNSIPRYLQGIRAITLGKESFRGILIIIDANDKPTQQFTTIQQALRNANFPAPEKPFSVEGDLFRVAVFLIPRKGENGTLEKLLLEAALENRPDMQTCLDNFCDCTRSVKTWTTNQQAKMRLSALVAASCQDNPWASAGIMWSEPGNPVPIESECFNHIADFLKIFVS
ncbi:MAG: DUF3226 domain-containing protein [Desulfobaccales bacterium]|jgi:hypothetical protein